MNYSPALVFLIGVVVVTLAATVAVSLSSSGPVVDKGFAPATAPIKTMDEMRDEAFRRDHVQAEQLEAKNAAEARKAAARDDYARAYRACNAALRRDMPYFTDDGGLFELKTSTPEERVYRTAVRFSDDFSAAPVGVVECRINSRTNITIVVKVPM